MQKVRLKDFSTENTFEATKNKEIYSFQTRQLQNEMPLLSTDDPTKDYNVLQT